jgi:hypothetical protein
MDFDQVLRKWCDSLEGDEVAAAEASRFVDFLEREHPDALRAWQRAETERYVADALTEEPVGAGRKLSRHERERVVTAKEAALREVFTRAGDRVGLEELRELAVVGGCAYGSPEDQAEWLRQGKELRRDLDYAESRLDEIQASAAERLGRA